MTTAFQSNAFQNNAFQITPPVQSGGSGSPLQFPFKTRPLPPIDKLIEESALPPIKPSRSTAGLLAQQALADYQMSMATTALLERQAVVADYQMALLLLLSE